MNSKKELLAGIFVFSILLVFVNIAIIKYHFANFEMNGDQYMIAGMMKYVNPQDNRELFIPIYTKR